MNHLTKYQWMLLGTAFFFVSTLIHVPNQVLQQTRADAWMSYCLAALIIFLAFFALIRAFSRFPGKTGQEAVVSRFPIVGRLLLTGYVLLFLYIMSRDIRILIDFLKLGLLPKTPPIIICLLLVATTVFIARGGLHVFARLSELWLPCLLIVIFLLPAVMFPDFKPSFLAPAFAHGADRIGLGAWFLLPYMGELVALAFFATTSDMKKPITAILPVGLGMSTLLFLQYETILVLGVHIPTITLFPTYEMVRHVRITDFLDRFDLVIVGLWLPCMVTKISYSLYFVAKGLEWIVPGTNHKVLAAPIGLLAGILSFWYFENSILIYKFNEVWPWFGIVFMLLIPLALFVALRPRRNREVS